MKGAKFISKRLLIVFLMTSIIIGGFFVFGTLNSKAAMIAPPGPPGPPPPPENNNPAIIGIEQYKLDGLMVLEEGKRTAGDEMVLEATMSDMDGDEVMARFEVCPKNDPFDDNCMISGTIMESIYLPSGSTIKATTTPLSEGKYKWRIKVYDATGGETDWQEFGAPGNIDFEIDFVPKYTQNYSNYPSSIETDYWDDKEYASGFTQNYYCGSTIANCGCAITSAVMTLRYHGVFNNIDNDNVDPYTMNAWLKSTTTTSTADVIGYYQGNVNWKAIEKYARDPITNNSRIVFLGRRDGTLANTQVKQLLDNDLELYQPDIIRNEAVGHFLLATEKLATTYLVNDPFWYNTPNLNYTLTDEDKAKPYKDYKHDYNNVLNGLRRFAPIINCSISPCIWNIIDLTIASPADLLVIDPLGRRLGRDPVSGIDYQEIPDGTYTHEGIGNPENPGPSPHQLKSIWIPDALDGQYEVRVTGTGEGEYTLFSNLSDQQGETKHNKYEGHTQTGHQTVYVIEFDQQNIDQTNIEPGDTLPPTTTANIDGVLGKNNWYISEVEISLSAQDNAGGSGIWQIEYSPDNGINWQEYTSPINYENEGIHTLLYRSEDLAGNLEETKSLEIKIDQTPPEAEMFFDPGTKELVVQGEDEEVEVTKEINPEIPVCNPGFGNKYFKQNSSCLRDSSHAVGMTKIIYTLEDEAGNTLRLFFQQPKIQAKILTQLEKIQYNEDEPMEVNKYLHYNWTINWFSKDIKTLHQTIRSGFGEWIHAMYDQKQNKTTIIIKEDGVRQENLSGLVIIKLFTNQGEINYEYEQ